MNISNVKPGDTIQHYCTGLIINAKVTKVTATAITTEHEPVQWGNDFFKTSYLAAPQNEGTPQPVRPHAWKDGEQIKA